VRDERELTSSEIMRDTGATSRQLERWVAYGLLLPPTKHGRVQYWPSDTIRRVQVIQNRLQATRSLDQVAFELFLRGYALTDLELVRRVLLLSVEAPESLGLRGRHQRSPDPVTERRAITRNLTRTLDGALATLGPLAPYLLNDMQALYGVAGNDALSQPPAFDSMRAAIISASPEQLLKARLWANAVLTQHRADFERGMLHIASQVLGLERIMLPWHVCERPHPLIEVVRPITTIQALMRAMGRIEDSIEQHTRFFEAVTVTLGGKPLIAIDAPNTNGQEETPIA
jgi:DNA-binding transcriptional MerR regulator